MISAYHDPDTDSIYVLLGTGEFLRIDELGSPEVVYDLPSLAAELVNEDIVREDAYNDGYDEGYQDGQDEGYDIDDVDSARQEGYEEGYEDAIRDNDIVKGDD